MGKKTIGGAVIGYGGMGNFHAKKMDEVKGIELVGVYDIDPAQHELAKKRGYAYYDTREALLSDPKIDLVVVATPNDVHKEIVVDALAHGKNVVCEKPVTMTSADLEEMIAAAEKYGRLFTVHQNRRWDEDYLTAKKLIDSGELGRVYRIESRIHGSRGIPEGWRGEKKHGGGMLLDWGVHSLDQMLTMMGERKLLSVYASVTNITNDECDDGYSCVCVFEGGVEFVSEVYTNNFIAMPRWYIMCENGSAIVKDWDCNGEVVKVVDWQKYDVAPIAAGAGITKTMAPRTEDTIKTFPVKKVKADWTAFYKNLIAHLNGEEEIVVTHDQQRRLIRLIEAIFESAEKNEVIKF